MALVPQRYASGTDLLDTSCQFQDVGNCLFTRLHQFLGIFAKHTNEAWLAVIISRLRRGRRVFRKEIFSKFLM